MQITDLAPEITDFIIDYLHDDRASLEATALTCRRFLPTSQFHLFADVELKSQHLSANSFPKNLAHLVETLRLGPDSQPATVNPWAYQFGRYNPPPPSLTGRQLCEQLASFNPRFIEVDGIRSSANSTMFAALATTKGLSDSVKCLSLNGCCIDAQDPLTLAYSLPLLRCLRFSVLTFDNSRSEIRKIERPSPLCFSMYNRDNPDWSSITDRTSADADLGLQSIEVLDTEWTAELNLMLFSIFQRVRGALKLRLSVRDCDVRGLAFERSLLGQFINECGSRICQLELCLGGAPSSDKKTQDQSETPALHESTLQWIFDACPLLNRIQVSGSVSNTYFLKETINSTSDRVVMSPGQPKASIPKHK